jgi:murein DD-endopeptidase MepM/ murein hydrolase activator NlpD
MRVRVACRSLRHPENSALNLKRTALSVLCAVGVASPFAAAEAYALRTVVPGDTLGLIADRYRVSVDDVMVFNGLSSVTIHPGQVIKVPYVAAVGGPAEATAAPPPGFRWHVLGPGETLSTVAASHGVSVEALVGANPDISSLDRLPAGIELLVPPALGLVVTLQPGESLLDVVERHGVEPEALVRANQLRSPFDIAPGMLLFLPGVRPTEAMARLEKVREEENRYVWPLHGRLTSYFGPRNLGMGTSSFHRGIDVAAPWGTPVVAARSGTVTFAGWSTQGYGNLVRVRHAGNDETWYGHFSSIAVSVGQYVKQGQVIGYVGSTGISTGPHLHFELYEAGRAVDPLSMLR